MSALIELLAEAFEQEPRRPARGELAPGITGAAYVDLASKPATAAMKVPSPSSLACLQGTEGRVTVRSLTTRDGTR